MISICIADDHPLMREGIKKVLQNQMDMQVIGEATDGNDVFELLDRRLPDILILDLSMPGKSGLDLIRDLHLHHPNLPILIFSIHPAERFAVRTLKAGARGYLCKSNLSERLIAAIRKIVVQKRKYISPDVAEQLALQMDHDNRPPHESLSNREFEIMCLIAAGFTVHEIAQKLSLSFHTVHTYRARIKEKMNFNTNIEMAHYAMENQLIS